MEASAVHGKPEAGMECMSCMDDISEENYAEYFVQGKWLPSKFCVDCVETLLSSQWERYLTMLEKASCKAELRRLLERGPPQRIFDKNALPCPDGCEVEELWYSNENALKSSKLRGALEGEEREIWWQEKLAFEKTFEDEPNNL
mmetsp:Transcript_9061/g.13536  ORF Transcript_9061/g.13536 Transcript_9061/m.13536 type:complete len:144 (+) Transcript_9061:29-460(+)